MSVADDGAEVEATGGAAGFCFPTAGGGGGILASPKAGLGSNLGGSGSTPGGCINLKFLLSLSLYEDIKVA